MSLVFWLVLVHDILFFICEVKHWVPAGEVVGDDKSRTGVDGSWDGWGEDKSRAGVEGFAACCGVISGVVAS